MSAKLALIARRMQRQTPEKAPPPEGGHGLGAAIEKLIADEVERRVGDAMERKPPARVRQLFNAPEPVTDYRDLAPVPRTPAPKKPLNMLIHRDGADKILWCEMSDGAKFELIRDRAGKTIAMKEITESPVLPALDVPYKAEARQYQPGTLRKLYGNDGGND